ncbi:hypothetical protein [Luedemannella helvata]|uniref:Uncharacterized protein n=1 Tax=Luedemannella helvata TaxID=349315 RepID=A0ABP4X0K2_9ACTN
MNPITRLLNAIADRQGDDAADRARGLHVTYVNGVRTVHLPELPTVATAYRSRLLAAGELDDPAAWALAHREAAAPAASAGRPVLRRVA